MKFKKLNEASQNVLDADVEKAIIQVKKDQNNYLDIVKKEQKSMFTSNGIVLRDIVLSLTEYEHWYAVISIIVGMMESAIKNKRTMFWVDEQCMSIFKNDADLLTKYKRYIEFMGSKL